MKKKIVILAYILTFMTVYAKKSNPFASLENNVSNLGNTSSVDSSSTQIATDEVIIDLKNETLKSDEGINVRYGNLKLKTFEFQKDSENKKIKTVGDVFIEIEDGLNKVKIDTRDAEVSEDGNYGIFYDSKGYYNVAHITGAEAPNDKLYFGGETTEYIDGNLKISNAWFTTTPKIVEVDDPKEAQYHIESRVLEIIPDKQVNFRGNNLYLGSKDVTPFNLPWYSVNIRSGSEVPLFPAWGTDDDYGWNITWGMLYGDRNSKYKGGIAPKFGDQMGYLIGRWENEYTFDKIGRSTLNVTDALIYKKRDNNEVNYDPQDKWRDSNQDRWDVEYNHNYSGDNGYLNFGYRNVTENLISELATIRDDNEDAGRYDPNNSGNSNYLGDKPDEGDTINFYSLDTELEKLGKNKDITFSGRVKLLDDKESYQEVVDDRLSDIDYDTQGDHDLFTELALAKENSSYKIATYYEYLEDLDKGSSEEDLRSKAENFGFELTSKDRNLTLKYDEKNEDEYRTLRSWERTPNLDTIVNLSGLSDRNIDYVPWTVAKYDINDSKNLYLGLGEYSLLNTGYDYKVGYSAVEGEKELSRIEDPFRVRAIDAHNPSNNRDKEYNRFEDIVYEDTREDKITLDIFDDNTKFTFGGGRSKEEFFDREGIYSYTDYKEGDAYNRYINESDFYEVAFEQKGLSLGVLGELELGAGVRHDSYTKGYNQDTARYTSGGDETLKTSFNVGHNVSLLDNTNYYWRNVDKKIDNEFDFYYEGYSYKEGDDSLASSLGTAEEVRLKNKEDIYRYEDKITLGYGNTETIYKFKLEDRYDAADSSRRTGQIIENNLEFKVADSKVLELYYNTNSNYTDENTSNENINDLTIDEYGVDYYLGNHKLYYSKENWDYALRDVAGVDDVDETLSENTYGYEYTRGLDKWNFELVMGADDRYNLDQDAMEIATDNRIYRISYLNGGDVEHYYKATYEDYEQGEEVNKYFSSDVVSLRYEYRDKRFTKEDIENFGKREFNKDSSELTAADLERIRDILEEKESRSLDFDLRSITNESLSPAEYKQSLRLYLMFQRNKERYEATGNYFDSLEEIQASVYYTYGRWGAGYTFDQSASLNPNAADPLLTWKETERDHEFSAHVRFGKPSEGWRFKTFIGIKEQLEGNNGVNEDRNTLDKLGVEVAKELGFYQWGVALSKKYVAGIDDYEWEAAVQFTLLTFPSMPIFGVGASNSGGDEAKTSPETYLFNGLDIDDLRD